MASINNPPVGICLNLSSCQMPSLHISYHKIRENQQKTDNLHINFAPPQVKKDTKKKFIIDAEKEYVNIQANIVPIEWFTSKYQYFPKK
jgi:hypothetical protein